MNPTKIVHRPARIIIGIECRTSNASDAGPRDIPALWQRFYQEGIFDKIPHKASHEVLALYSDYEGDHTQPYSVVIGCPARSLQEIPQGMVAKIIPTSTFAIFSVRGEYPQSLIDAWGEIWRMDLKRAYAGDYEIYGEKFSTSKELEITISLQEELKPEKIEETIRINRMKFEEIKQLNLPLGHYALTGSGPLGIRNLRKIGDIDLLVTPELWGTLAAQYGITYQNGIRRIVFPNRDIEALSEVSYKKESAIPTIADRIACAEIIEGLPFESLKHVLYFKCWMGREKDLNDIYSLEKWIKKNQGDRI